VTLFFPILPSSLTETTIRSDVQQEIASRAEQLTSQSLPNTLYAFGCRAAVIPQVSDVILFQFADNTRDQDQSGYEMKFGPNRRISVTRFIKDALIRVLQCCSPLAHKHKHKHKHTNWQRLLLVESLYVAP